MAGAVMETAIESGADGNPKRASFAAKFRQLKEDCPMEVNDYTTLEWVKMKGINRIEFRYRVSESGRGIVNMNNWINLDPEIIQRTADSPIGASVVALDLGVDHIFKDTDGKQMYSKSVTKLELKKAEEKAALAEKRRLAEEKLAELKKNTPASPASNGTGITITDLSAGVPVKSAQSGNIVIGAGRSRGDVEVTNTSMPAGHSSSNAPPVSTRSSFVPGTSNPAGVQHNPYLQ